MKPAELIEISRRGSARQHVYARDEGPTWEPVPFREHWRRFITDAELVENLAGGALILLVAFGGCHLVAMAARALG